jgi:hypothetical protein
VKRDAERPMYWIRRLGEQTAAQDKASQERNAAERQGAAERARARPAATSPRSRPQRRPAARRPEPPPPRRWPPETARHGPGQAASGNDIALAGPGPALAAAAPPSRAHPRPSRPWPAPPVRRGSDAPATDRTGGTDVAMATPPHHAEPAAPPAPVADTLVLRAGESLALPDSLMRRMRRARWRSGSRSPRRQRDGRDHRAEQPPAAGLGSAGGHQGRTSAVSRPTTAVIQFGFDLDS